MSGAREEAVTSVEVTGSVGWITSAVAYVVYLLWAYVPHSVLEGQGITYYPSKHWAVALPAWFCVSVVFVYWVYECLNMMATPSPREEQQLRIIRPGASYFSSTSGDTGLPLVEIPAAVVDMVLQQGKTPQEAEAEYRRWQGQAASGRHTGSAD